MTPRGMSSGPCHMTTHLYFILWCDVAQHVQLKVSGNSQYFECDVIMMIALWRYGGGAKHNALFLTTASNVNSPVDVANYFIQTKLDTGNNTVGQLWAISLVRATQSRDKRATILLMMTSSNGNIFRFTGPLCGEFTGHRWIPLTKAGDATLWCFLSHAPE